MEQQQREEVEPLSETQLALAAAVAALAGRESATRVLATQQKLQDEFEQGHRRQLVKNPWDQQLEQLKVLQELKDAVGLAEALILHAVRQGKDHPSLQQIGTALKISAEGARQRVKTAENTYKRIQATDGMQDTDDTDNTTSTPTPTPTVSTRGRTVEELLREDRGRTIEELLRGHPAPQLDGRDRRRRRSGTNIRVPGQPGRPTSHALSSFAAVTGQGQPSSK